MRSRMMFAAAAVALLTGCTADGPVSDGCAWTRPILVGPDDVLTDDTAQQILIHNETGARVGCWRGPAE